MSWYYEGDEICFSKWPFGMELHYKEKEDITILIRSPKDAKNIISSLQEFVNFCERGIDKDVK